MDQIFKNPGFQHIVENILLNLDYKDLLACELINKSCQEILENPLFWLKKLALRGMSKKNQDDWYNAIQITKSQTVYGKKLNLVKYLKKIVKNSRSIDVPCYIDQNTLDEENTLDEVERERLYVCKYGYIPNYALFAHKYACPFCKFVPGVGGIDDRCTSGLILQAAFLGHINTIKLVASLVDYPNVTICSSKKFPYLWSKITLSDIAKSKGHHEAAKFLKAYEKQ